MNLLAWLLVPPAGALGALARHGTGRLVAKVMRRGAPWGVTVVNMLGSFVVGLIAGLALGQGAFLVVVLGFLGAYTTFSTWMLETDLMAEQGRHVAALLNLLGPAIGGMLLVAAGIAAGSALG